MTVSNTVEMVLASPCFELGSPAPVSRMVPPCNSSSSTWILEGGAASGGLTSSCVGGGGLVGVNSLGTQLCARAEVSVALEKEAC